MGLWCNHKVPASSAHLDDNVCLSVADALDEVICDPLDSIQRILALARSFVARLKVHQAPGQHTRRPSHGQVELDVVAGIIPAAGQQDGSAQEQTVQTCRSAVAGVLSTLMLTHQRLLLLQLSCFCRQQQRMARSTCRCTQHLITRGRVRATLTSRL